MFLDFEENWEGRVVMDAGAGEGFGDDGGLAEFEAEAEVEDWVLETWRDISVCCLERLREEDIWD